MFDRHLEVNLNLWPNDIFVRAGFLCRLFQVRIVPYGGDGGGGGIREVDCGEISI